MGEPIQSQGKKKKGTEAKKEVQFHKSREE